MYREAGTELHISSLWLLLLLTLTVILHLINLAVAEM